MSVSLSKERKAEIIASMRRFFSEKLQLELSEVQAGFLLDYFFHEIAPLAYNQAVEDAQKYLTRLVEDLPGICFQEPLTYWTYQAVRKEFAANRIVKCPSLIS
jgi:uncharacterized protein (DUF2164 family)